MCEIGVDPRARTRGHRRRTWELGMKIDRERQGQVMKERIEDASGGQGEGIMFSLMIPPNAANCLRRDCKWLKVARIIGGSGSSQKLTFQKAR